MIHSDNMRWLVAKSQEFAAKFPSNPVLAAIAGSVEVGVVVPSVLLAKLEAIPSVSVIFDDDDHAKHGHRVLKNGWRAHVVGPGMYHGDPRGSFDPKQRLLLAAGVWFVTDPDALARVTDDDMKRVSLLAAMVEFVRDFQRSEDRAAGLPKRTFGLGTPAALDVKA